MWKDQKRKSTVSKNRYSIAKLYSCSEFDLQRKYNRSDRRPRRRRAVTYEVPLFALPLGTLERVLSNSAERGVSCAVSGHAGGARAGAGGLGESAVTYARFSPDRPPALACSRVSVT
ncbi:hypothetical protein EVAR_94089_1 [Eumeta japonica]|uniref:Uncharacterized protein n=1 Tax=Eumeta variegata TaxID=151549 RepID=A0A4C1V6N5_EUMVA|nr:hypothetical protein EVAR_94089_1 [Eumeta japonica]